MNIPCARSQIIGIGSLKQKIRSSRPGERAIDTNTDRCRSRISERHIRFPFASKMLDRHQALNEKPAALEVASGLLLRQESI